MTPTNNGLVEHCENLLGAGYVYGAYFDKPITESYLLKKAAQYPKKYNRIMSDGKTYLQYSRRWIGKLAGDCVGLIKSYYWTDENGVVQYLYENRRDLSGNGIYEFATEKGDINTIPELPGIGVWQPGHVGVYVGFETVIESRGVDYGVVMTALQNRGWRAWFKIPYIDYVGGDSLQRGDKGVNVGLWQDALVKWNFAALPVYGASYPIDGKKDLSFGPMTENWTKEFQKEKGIVQTGIVSVLEWSMMVNHFTGLIKQIHSIAAKGV